MHLLAPPCLFVCLSVAPSACNNSRTTEHHFIKFYIGEFYWNLLTHSGFGWNWTIRMSTLHEDLHTFLHPKVGIHSQWIPSQSCVIESSVMTSLSQSSFPHTGHWLQGTLTSLMPFTKVRGQNVAKAPELLSYAYIS
jgi:hypothetical protein